MRIDIHSLENSKRVSKQKIEYKKWQHSHASKQRQSKNGQQTTNETSRVTLTSWPVETEREVIEYDEQKVAHSRPTKQDRGRGLVNSK